VNTRLADRMASIAPFHVMDILARAREMEVRGASVVHMEVGEPDFDTPASVVAAGQRALAEGRTHYTAAAGMVQLREAISTYYRDRFAVDIDPRRILVTPGASGALQLVLGVLVNPGDEVLVTDPGYPCNRHMVRMYGGNARSLELDASNDFALTEEALASALATAPRALMLASPSKPTGQVIQADKLAAYYRQVCATASCSLIVDEIYQGLQYDSPVHTALSLGRDELFVINSFSKFFGMTGWRLGWVVAPETYVEAMDRLAQNIFLSAPTVSQYAALAAFGSNAMGVYEERRQIFQQRRDFLHQSLDELGFNLLGRPDGAFYLYADISAFSDDSERFVRELLDEAHVAITPGIDFGTHQSQRFVRFAYTTGQPRLETAMQRLTTFLRAGS